MTEITTQETDRLSEDKDEDENDEEYEPHSCEYDPEKVNIATRAPVQ